MRVHSECATGDLFGSRRCDCGEQLERALRQIADRESEAQPRPNVKGAEESSGWLPLFLFLSLSLSLSLPRSTPGTLLNPLLFSRRSRGRGDIRAGPRGPRHWTRGQTRGVRAAGQRPRHHRGERRSGPPRRRPLLRRRFLKKPRPLFSHARAIAVRVGRGGVRDLEEKGVGYIRTHDALVRVAFS